jgi:hypothetical protein
MLEKNYICKSITKTKIMKKITLLSLLIVTVSFLFSSCAKEEGFVINSEVLKFNVDSMSIAGPIEKTANLNYDLDVIANDFDLKVNKYKAFKFKSITFKIIECDLRFDDIKFIKLNITAKGLSAKEILPSIEVPVGTDKEFTVANMPDLDVLNYMEAGNVVITFAAETRVNNTKAAVIQAVPTVDVLGLSKLF